MGEKKGAGSERGRWSLLYLGMHKAGVFERRTVKGANLEKTESKNGPSGKIFYYPSGNSPYMWEEGTGRSE